MKNDNYRLTESQLKKLLLVSRVAIGVRVESEEHQDEESTGLEKIWTGWTPNRLKLIVINRIAD